MTDITTETPAPGYALAPGEGERLWIVGDTMTIKADAASTGGSLSVFEVLATPGGGPPPHTHANEDEAWFVLDGEFDVHIDGRAHRLGAGGFAFARRGVVHRFECVGDEAGRILVWFAPGGMDGFFREAGRRATDDGPAPPLDDEEIARTEVAARRYGLRVVEWR